MSDRVCARLLRLTTVATLVLALVGGCYVPVRFAAEVVVSRTGWYEMRFVGDVIWAPLYEKLRKGEISPLQEQETVAIILSDLRRDSAMKNVHYGHRGTFRIAWERSGDLLATKMVSFIRRNEKVLSLKYVKDTHEITLEGASLPRVDANRLADAGLSLSGDLRVRTDAKVIRHNATTVAEDGAWGQIYTWKINNAFDPAPRLVIALR